MKFGWLKHAFAVEAPGPAIPTADELAALDPLLKEVIRRRMVQPAILFLESMRGLNFVTGQTMHFFQPFAAAVVDPLRYETLARYCEKRGSIDWLCDELTRRSAE